MKEIAVSGIITSIFPSKFCLLAGVFASMRCLPAIKQELFLQKHNRCCVAHSWYETRSEAMAWFCECSECRRCEWCGESECVKITPGGEKCICSD